MGGTGSSMQVVREGLPRWILALLETNEIFLSFSLSLLPRSVTPFFPSFPSFLPLFSVSLEIQLQERCKGFWEHKQEGLG